MSRIQTRFDARRAAGRAALIPYITAGDPDADATVDYMHALVAAGADIIELGVPFTDPMADGPVIQAACERALRVGTSLSDVLDCVAGFRKSDTDTPVVLMGYLNPIESMGLAVFAERASEVGVDGVLIVDMTAEEAPETLPVLTERGLDPICLIAPTTTDERIRRICKHSAGFVYYVSTKGVTGGAGLQTDTLAAHLDRIRAHTDLPLAVGFGIREPADAVAAAGVAEAVVVGSALVRRIGEYGDDQPGARAALSDTLGDMRRAMDAEQSRDEVAL